MADAAASEEIVTERAEDLEALQQRASALERKADAATRKYERTSWLMYGAIVIPIPFGCCSFGCTCRPGATTSPARFVVLALTMYAMDLAALARRDETIQTRSAPE